MRKKRVNTIVMMRSTRPRKVKKLMLTNEFVKIR
jgi:hypothetical protein